MGGKSMGENFVKSMGEKAWKKSMGGNFVKKTWVTKTS